MEQEVEYKKAFATITNLEQQLESTSDAGLAKVLLLSLLLLHFFFFFNFTQSY